MVTVETVEQAKLKELSAQLAQMEMEARQRLASNYEYWQAVLTTVGRIQETLKH